MLFKILHLKASFSFNCAFFWIKVLKRKLTFHDDFLTLEINRFSSYLSDLGKDSISGQRTGLSVEQQGPALLGFNSLFGEKTVTSRWEVSFVTLKDE